MALGELHCARIQPERALHVPGHIGEISKPPQALVNVPMAIATGYTVTDSPVPSEWLPVVR